MENKLKIFKENIFSKIINKLKKWLYIYKKENVEQHKDKEHCQTECDNRSRFLDGLKLDKEEDPKFKKLQDKFENNELDSMTTEEIKQLATFYNQKNEDMKKNIENARTTLNILKRELKKYGNS